MSLPYIKRLSIIGLLIAHGLAHAAPAAPNFKNFQQADGSQFSARVQGDEHFSWVENQNGEVVLFNPDSKNYEYAELDKVNKRLKHSGRKVLANPPKAVTGQAFLQNINQNLKSKDQDFSQFAQEQEELSTKKQWQNYKENLEKQRAIQKKSISNTTTSKTVMAFNASGTVNTGNGGTPVFENGSDWDALTTPPSTIPLLVVLVNFNNRTFKSTPADWQKKVFGTAVGEHNYYWQQMTGGKIQFTPAQESSGTANDGVISLSLNIAHPNNTDPTRTGAVVDVPFQTILNAADPLVNFSQYDTNGDGLIQSYELTVVTVYAGYEASEGNGKLPAVWGHATLGTALDSSIEGKTGFARVSIGELFAGDTTPTIGLVAHELGHAVFALPDLYGPGIDMKETSIMSNSWGATKAPYATAPSMLLQGGAPTSFSAWERYRLGLSSAQTVVPSATNQVFSLKSPIQAGGLLRVNVPNRPLEYFLIETRIPTDFADVSYQMNSLIQNTPTAPFLHIYQVNEGGSSNVNGAPNGLIKPIYAETLVNGLSTYNYFFPSNGKTSLTKSVAPNLLSYSNRDAQFKITSITSNTTNKVVSLSIAQDLTAPPFTKLLPLVYLRGTHNSWGLTTSMTLVGNNLWEGTLDFGTATTREFKFDGSNNWTKGYGENSAAGDLIADLNGSFNITVPNTLSGNRSTVGLKKFVVTFDDFSRAYRYYIVPFANAGVDLTTKTGTNLIFTDTAANNAGLSCTWIFANGERIKGCQYANHVFNKVGTEKVILRTVNELGQYANDEAIVTVTAPPPNVAPIANAGPDQTVFVNNAFNLNSFSTDADNDVLTCTWTLPSGQILTGCAPLVTFDTAGTKGVNLTVDDGKGHTASDTVIITVQPLPSALKRTIIFIYGQTVAGQDLFIRGGIDHTYAATIGMTCTQANMLCAIPIQHLNSKNATTNPWKTGDTMLDWYGIQTGQSATAQGTPLDWTTNNAANGSTVAVNGFGYTPLNTWGDHYWMLDVTMDCSKTINGWFEVKSFISGTGTGTGWEADVSQANRPWASGNHFAQCGQLNMFKRGDSSAIIQAIP